MAEVKLLHLDADSEWTQHDSTADSITFLGITTGTGGLTVGADIDMVGNQINNLSDGLLASDAATYGQVLAIGGGTEWQDSVIDKDLTAPPGTPVTNDRYLLGLDTTAGATTGAWAGKDGQIAKYNGATWDFTVPAVGMHIAADDEVDRVFLFGGVTWTAKLWENTTASTGLQKVGVDVQIDLDGTLGANLFNPFNINANGLSFKLDDASIGVNGSNQLEVKLNGVNDTHIDFGTGAGQVSGVDLPIADAGSYFATDNVEAALQSLGADIGANKPEANADGTGVSKGDVVYFSANNTVSTLSSLSGATREVGLAAETIGAGIPVEIVSSNRILTAVLTAATFGKRQWWNGTGFQETPPTGAGNKRILGGFAKNATDLYVKLQRLTILA